jgi:hypothetical protein
MWRLVEGTIMDILGGDSDGGRDHRTGLILVHSTVQSTCLRPGQRN